MATHETATAYPLAWPTGWKRTPISARTRAKFSRKETKTYNQSNGQTYNHTSTKELTLAEARDRLMAELERLGSRDDILSTNLELRMDGLPRSGQKSPEDSGAAVYFKLKGKPMVLACDKWDRVEGNVAAIAAHIGAMRGMDRWGVGNLDQAFAGYTALPAPTASKPWHVILACDPRSSLAEIETIYRVMAKTLHPDAEDGDADAMAILNGAIADARREKRA